MAGTRGKGPKVSYNSVVMSRNIYPEGAKDEREAGGGD